ncbi:MAG: RNase adapter RapZ [Pseudomonadota bacterium]|jgi:RNase adapter protein RapZ
MKQMRLVLITGMSGSGKSSAISALEDAGFFCVNNLPPALLETLVALQLLQLQQDNKTSKLAVAMDARSAASLKDLPQILHRLKDNDNVAMTTLFLDSSDDVLIRRFSETRRSHPLSKSSTQQADKHALLDAIRLEREMLSDLRERAHVVDTSLMRVSNLISHINALIDDAQSRLTLVFESFAFKRGVPMDADYVFDVRMLPNPHYEPSLRRLTGRDPAVIDFLDKEPVVAEMIQHITQFLYRWLPEHLKEHRSYVTVAIGCTGGQHRSVYLVEQLAARFRADWQARSLHRELGI